MGSAHSSRPPHSIQRSSVSARSTTRPKMPNRENNDYTSASSPNTIVEKSLSEEAQPIPTGSFKAQSDKKDSASAPFPVEAPGTDDDAGRRTAPPVQDKKKAVEEAEDDYEDVFLAALERETPRGTETIGPPSPEARAIRPNVPKADVKNVKSGGK